MVPTESKSTGVPLRLWPKSWMGRFALAAAVVWLFQEFVLQRLFPPVTLGLQLLYDLFFVLLLVPLMYYGFRVGLVLKRQLLWKIRRRLILSHIFVAVIPILVIVSIVLLSALLIYYQFSYYLVLNQIGLHTGHVEAYTMAMRSGIDNLLDRPSVDRADVRQFLNQLAQFLQASYPQAGIHVRIDDRSTGETSVFHAGFAEKLPLTDYRIPEWLKETDFSGLIFEPMDPTVLLKEGLLKKRTQWSNLSIRAVAFSDSHADYRFSVEVFVPLDRFFLKKLKAALGVDLMMARTDVSESAVFDTNFPVADSVIAATDEGMLANLQKRQTQPLPMHLYPVLWENGKEAPTNRADLLYMQLSLTRLYQNLFLSESKLSRDIAEILKFLLLFFLVVELVSVFIGVVLTKSITSAVFNLDRGTQLIKRGDFSHRIVVKSDDQLGNLAESFNNMVESVQSLMRERVVRERLERELEIAKEVQAQLFPKSAPQIPGLEVCGICLPARTVSGDYFDFLLFRSDVFGIVVGDICGKGISAALLMANLQATLRSHVARFELDDNRASTQLRGENAVAHLMEQLNRQIFCFTSPNKFASLFSVFFDPQLQSLTYCNAGHNPPILLQSGRPQQLKAGGTVVGIFAEACYRQATIPLRAGDLLLAYTDGIIEAVNEYGEEFGEQRLENLLVRHKDRPVEKIQEQVIDAIVDWSYGQDRDDDMTLVLARVHEEWSLAANPN